MAIKIIIIILELFLFWKLSNLGHKNYKLIVGKIRRKLKLEQEDYKNLDEIVRRHNENIYLSFLVIVLLILTLLSFFIL